MNTGIEEPIGIPLSNNGSHAVTAVVNHADGDAGGPLVKIGYWINAAPPDERAQWEPDLERSILLDTDESKKLYRLLGCELGFTAGLPATVGSVGAATVRTASIDVRRTAMEMTAQKLLARVRDDVRFLREHNVGVLLMAFEFGKGGALAYISSAERAGMIDVLKEFGVSREPAP